VLRIERLAPGDGLKRRCKSGVASNRTGTVSSTVPSVTEPATVGPHDASLHAGQVVRRVLLRRNIVIDAETAQLVAVAVQAALQAGAPSRPPRRGRRVPAADCEPLF
jgi:CHASE2 domain-containing sensor protein